MEDFTNLFSSLKDVHGQCFTPASVEKSMELILIELDNSRKAICIDSLASLTMAAWNCRLALERRKKFLPLLKNLLQPEILTSIVGSSSHEVRYALAKLLVHVAVTNEDSQLAVNALKDVGSYPFQLLWCRRMLSFVSKNVRSPCERCVGGDHVRAIDQTSAIDLLIQIWSKCLTICLGDHSCADESCMIELLATSNEFLGNDLANQRAIDFFASSWSSNGKAILDLLLSSNRLIIRQVLELLYAMLSMFLHDRCTRQTTTSSAFIEVIATDTLSNVELSEVQSSLRKNVTTTTWFGGVLDGGQCGDSDTDKNLVRLSILVPAIASALAFRLGSKLTSSSGELAPNYLFPDISSNPHRLVSLLMEQDDHFVDYFLCTVITTRLSVDRVDSAHVIWLNFLNNIGWHQNLVLDWIASSETSFLSAFTHYLKLVASDPPALLACCHGFQLPIMAPPAGPMPNSTDMINSPEKFNVVEIIGDIEKTRTVQLKTLRKRETDQEVETIVTTADVSSKLFGFFDQLQTKLDRLDKRNLIGFNVQPLLVLLRRVKEIK